MLPPAIFVIRGIVFRVSTTVVCDWTGRLRRKAARCQVHARGQARNTQTDTLAYYLFRLALSPPNPARSYLQHYGYVGSGHYYIAQYYVTASFDPMAMVRSYGCARFYGSVVPRRPPLWFYGMTPLDPMSSRQCGVQYYGSMDLWYVWSYPMPGSMVCVVRSYVWSYPMCGLFCVAKYYGSVVCPVLSYVVPAYDPNLCVAVSYVSQACDPMVCLVLSYVWICGMSGPILCRPLCYGRRRPSTYFAQSHQTSAYVRVCGPHRNILGPRSAAWCPGGQRSRQDAPTLPCLIVQLGKVES
jgi:hypothetical protein